MARGRHQHRKVLHGSGNHRAQYQPHQPRRESELRGQRGAYQWSGAGNGCKMVPEEHPLRRRRIVLSIPAGVRGGDPRIVEHQNPGGQKCAVVAIGQRIYAQNNNENGKCVHYVFQEKLASGLINLMNLFEQGPATRSCTRLEAQYSRVTREGVVAGTRALLQVVKRD